MPGKSNLCDNCHVKPKFQNHDYCGKNCADEAQNGRGNTKTQATRPAPVTIPQQAQLAPSAVRPQRTATATPSTAQALCDYCGANPKKPNSAYCGTLCGGLAIAPVQGNGAPTPQAVGGATQGQTNVGPARGPTPGAGAALVNPILGGAPGNNGYANGTAAPSPVAGPGQVKRLGQQGPLVGGVPNTIPAQRGPTQGGRQPIWKQGPQALIFCLIPGCGKPAYVDSSGFQSGSYCSMRHREEAVTQGLAQACIMCRRLPQGESDYFCGRTCRDAANSKA